MKSEKESEPMDETLIDAFRVFLQYGYRKTSLDDVAKSVGYSRQTLYQRYRSKEELFVASVKAETEMNMKECRDILSKDTLNIEEQLLEASCAWWGRHIDIIKSSIHGPELLEALEKLDSDFCAGIKSKIVDMFAQTLKKHNVPSFKDKSITSATVAETIRNAADGACLNSASKEEFSDEMQKALSVICKV